MIRLEVIGKSKAPRAAPEVLELVAPAGWALIDTTLYPPVSWTDDRQRRVDGGVPGPLEPGL